MKTLSPALQSHLAGGVTTLALCWRLETAAGDVLGFTDHDRDLTFAGTSYRSQPGFTASERQAMTGLGSANLEVAGVVDDERLSEERLRAGDFDGAAIEIWQANWQDVSQRVLLRKGRLGEVKRGELGFTAELRGLAQLLNEPKGRIFQYGCDAIVGDARCGVNLNAPQYRGVATVISAEGNRRLIVAGLATFADGWFADGVAHWTAGANAGRRQPVKSHRLEGTSVVIELWQEAGSLIAAGDTFAVTAGCDRQFSTCRSKFANGLNFRGFPHMPGNDFVTSYPNRDDGGNDGGRRHL
jgi:uncharacterized phage protein (TIGR02218 family)